MKKRIIIIIAILLVLASITTTIAFAVPPSNPHIESGSAADGGNFFEYYSNGSWHDLKTPPHWVEETGEVAYCLEHKMDSAHGELYYKFNAEALYSDRTYDGLMAILMHTYPYRNAGLADQQIRYATANAIRSWLRESAGIGYDFMLPSNNALRAKSSGAGAWNFYNQLMEKARAGESAFIAFSVNTSPSTLTLTESNGKLTGTVTVTFSYCKNYTIDYSKVPSGVSISGYTGNSRDKLTITAPISMQGQTKTLSNVFVGNNNRGSANFYWLDTSSGKQAVVVPVVDTYNPVAYGTLKFTSEAPPAKGYIEIIKTDVDTGAELQGAVYQILNSYGTILENLTTDANGYAKSKAYDEGTYSIREVTAPSGYVLDTTTYNNIAITADNTNTVNLTNAKPKGVIRITKTNDSPEDGDYSLAGAVFEIRDEDGNVIEHVTTNNQGKANSSQLPLGTYIVEEKTAPDGYVLNTKDFEVTLSYANQNTAIVYGDVTVSEKPQTGIIVIDKRNSNTSLGDYSLQGAVFEIRNSSDTLIETVTTNINGDAVSQRLPLGEYTVTEITAPYGYVLDDKDYTVNLKYGGQLYSAIHGTLTVSNTPQTGIIRVSKTNLNPSKGDYSLEGAVFEVYDSYNTLADTITTNADGEANSKKLPLGDYTVKEITAPYGYTLNTDVFNVSFEYGNQENTVVYSDIDVLQMPQVGKIEITKINGNPSLDNHPLNGAIFEVRNSNGDMLDRVTTDENGSATTVELPLGEYTIVETQAPAGYVLNENEFRVTLEYSNQYEDIVITSIEIPNDPMTGTITIEKEDAETGIIPQGEATLNGAVFNISRVITDTVIAEDIGNNDLEFIETIECGDSSTATSSELPLGYYAVKEVTAPMGYTLGNNYELIEVTGSSTRNVSFAFYNNVITGTIAITKRVDKPLALWGTEEYEYPLEGIKFEVRSKESNELVAELYTDRTGYVESKPLPYGSYIFSEPYPPTGYTGSEPFEVTIDTDSEVHEFEVTNYVLKSNITIVKKDVDTDEIIPIAGTEFRILDINNKPVVIDGKKVFTTDESGAITLAEPLIYGDYTLQEIIPPHGYWLNDESMAFTVWNNEPITLECFDQLILKRIQIVKTDERDENRTLAGAVFEVYKNNELIQTITTNEDGIAMSKYLRVGDYTVKEVKAPEGFILEDIALDFTISDDETMVYTAAVTNRPTRVIITKTDMEGKQLNGACIEVYNQDEHLVYKGFTGDNGEIEISELSVGKYYFYESIAPSGYILNEKIYEFEVLINGDVIGDTEIKNEPTEITLSKIDITNSLPIAGAKFTVFDDKSNKVTSGKTDENGKLMITHLPIGTYTFIETYAPEGYILSTEELTFTIDEYGTVTGETTMSNCPTALEINKVIYETSEPLTGAGFKVKNFLGLFTVKFTLNADGSYHFDKNGEVTEIMVDENGKAIVYGLPFGNYWLEETTVPTGYYPTAPVKVTIDENSTLDFEQITIIPNSEFVKLGLDRERWLYPLAAVAVVFAASGIVFIRRKKKKGGK